MLENQRLDALKGYLKFLDLAVCQDMATLLECVEADVMELMEREINRGDEGD